jgi:hypothetical protein
MERKMIIEGGGTLIQPDEGDVGETAGVVVGVVVVGGAGSGGPNGLFATAGSTTVHISADLAA